MAKAKRRPGRPGLTPDQARRVRAAVRALLAQHDGSKKVVGDLLGITGSAVTQIDKGKNAPSISTAIAAAHASGTTLSALLGEA